MRCKLVSLFLIIYMTLNLFGQEKESQKLLLIRCDDIGMSHAVNLAAKELIETGLIFSASVMFPCAWYQEGVDLLKSHPEITAGIHLTLNSEWKNYRWGPVAGKDKVPSLVDEHGYFFPSRAAFFNNNPKLEEVEIELRAQIDRAVKSGLKVSYVDYHMGTAVDRPELRNIVEKLATEYGLGISRYFGEEDVKNMYSDPIDSKRDSLIFTLKNLPSEKISLLVCHIGVDNDELQAMIDMNSFGLNEMSKHRESELRALVSVMNENLFELNNIRLITYDDLIKEIGLSKMKSPVETGY
ncbi:MAG: polysaccharide deacetylase family protein [Melioribacteraceae bacterium]|nr:polysaccharide deacetylase family protein [Melioribacteraceae bacterium]